MKQPNKEKCPYTSRLQKGGALLEDMRLLVRNWDGVSRDEQRQLVIAENSLGKTTRARAVDTFIRAFAPRFLDGDPPQAWRLVRLLEDLCLPVETLKPVYYWITARSEPLLYRYVTDELFEQAKGIDPSVRVEETARWIRNKLYEYGQQWTETVTMKTARGLLAALRDFGILEGKARKRIAPMYLPVESFAYIAFALHELRFSGESLVKHRDWQLFLMGTTAVERMFLDAHQRHLLSYEAAGSIYRIDFPDHTIEGMANVIAGR